MSDATQRRAGLVGAAGSLALHASVVLLAFVVLEAPETGFEFEAPADLELGFTQEVDVEASAGDLPAQGAEEASEPPPAEAVGGTVGSAPEPPRPRREPRPPSPARQGAGGDASPVAFLPRGAQLAMRIDMDRVRSSPIGEELRGVLALIPEWRALLGGSGLDPVGDLSRILVATPNLQRDRLVVAGRLAPGAPTPRDVAEQTARSRAEPIAWETVAGVDTTPWPGSDGVSRTLAVLSDTHFVVSRREDLSRVLAIALARRGRRSPPSAAPADALLSMEEGEGLSIEVEGAAAFVRRSPCAIPERMRLGLLEGQSGVEVRVSARFESPMVAQEAGACLQRVAEQASHNILVNLYGLGGPLERLEAHSEEEHLTLTTRLTYAEIRVIFNLLRGLLSSRAGPTPAPPPPVPLPPSPPPPPPSPFK